MAESDGLPHGLSSIQPTVMTKFELQGDWNLTKLKLKQKQNWAQLTEGDLQFVKGSAGGTDGLDSATHRPDPRRHRTCPQRILRQLLRMISGVPAPKFEKGLDVSEMGQG